MKITDQDLLNYSDGKMDSERMERLRQAALNDDKLAESVSMMEASRLPYKAAYAQAPTPPVPDTLKKTVSEMVAVSQSHPASTDRPRFGRLASAAVAAAVISGFGLGYLTANYVDHPDLPPSVTSLSVDPLSMDPLSMDIATGAEETVNADEKWAKRVADYQSLYVRNTVAGIKGAPTSANTLLSELMERTGLRTGVPDLGKLGYHFVRAQELGYQGDTLVQLIYLKDGKTPLALCYMRSGASTSSELALTNYNGLGTAYWRDADLRFVIVADETETELRKLHKEARSLWS